MFCPQCKAEYLRGVTRCSDCDVPLVEQLTESPGDSDFDLSNAKLRSVWKGEDEASCVSICEGLKQAAIPFKVDQHRRQLVKGDVEEHYEIGVPPKLWSQAKEIADSGCVDFNDDPADQAIMEVPAQDDVLDAPNADEDPDRGKWRREDATEEVWSEHNEEQASMIKSSLQENDIHYRADVEGKDWWKIFVMPKDKIRACEIVREIVDGSPPR